MENIIVTGANGFLGKYLIERLLNHGKRVLAIVRVDNGQFQYKSEKFKILECDLEEPSVLQNKLKDSSIAWDTIYHLAWEGSSGIDRGNPSYQSKNIDLTLKLINSAADIGVKRFIGAGTLAEVECQKIIFDNTMIPNPVSLYAASKIATHMMSKIVCNNLGIQHVWGIFSNIYGIGDTNNFVNFAARLMLEGKRASFTEGNQLYDFIFVEDFIDGLYLLGEYGIANHEYFLGSGHPRKLKEYIYDIRDTIDPSIPLYLGEIPYRGISLTQKDLDVSIAQKELGFTAKTQFKDGIEKTVQWMKTQMEHDHD